MQGGYENELQGKNRRDETEQRKEERKEREGKSREEGKSVTLSIPEFFFFAA